MITEQYVSFETAKLLKEKGFDGECRDYYNTEGHFYSEDFKSNWNNERGPITIFSAPTQSLAMRWLREVHHILISVNIFLPHKPTWIYSYYNLNRGYIRNAGQYNTYEEACETAIQYCLKNLI